MSDSFLDLHAGLDLEIGRLVLAEMYEEDDSADLVIVVEGDQYSITLKSALQPIIFPDDDLLYAVGKLVDLHIERGSHLRSATYHYEKEAAGTWVMSAKFEYDRPEGVD
ncbi:hypothetical protein [Nocardia lasii]|uniref:Uncharacterized protein n=1 Tax=Nocardia lasii TaxID=1616107 RepID=A0ABW1JQX2_9NOCA